MIKKLSCVSHGSLKRFPHTFTNLSHIFLFPYLMKYELCLTSSKINSGPSEDLTPHPLLAFAIVMGMIWPPG